MAMSPSTSVGVEVGFEFEFERDRTETLKIRSNIKIDCTKMPTLKATRADNFCQQRLVKGVCESATNVTI